MAVLKLLGQIKFGKQFLLYFLIAQAVILLSNHQIFQEIAATPPGKVNLMVHRDWPTDYYGQLAFITQGASGFWLRYAPYSVESNKPGIFYAYYLIVGKAGGLLNIEPHIIYHLARIASVELFVVGLYALSILLLGRSSGVTGAYIGLLSTVAPFYFLPQTIQITWYPYGYPWWENLDSLERLYLPPHHVFGQAMMLWALYFLFSWFERPSVRHLFAFSGAFLTGALTFPPIFIPFAVATLPAYLIFIIRQFILRRVFSIPKRHIVVISIVYLFVLFIYLMLSYHESLGYPWNYTKYSEIARWNQEPSFDKAMPYIFGILPILALPAFIRAFVAGAWRDIFIALWAIIPYVFLPFADALQFPKIRLVHENPYVPLSILSVQSIVMLAQLLKKQIIIKIIFGLFLLTVIPVSFNHLYNRYASVDYFLSNGDTRQFFVPRSMTDAFAFMRENVPPKSHVMSDYLSGAIITGFAPVITLIGSRAELDLDYKNYFTRAFLYENMPERDARRWLRDYSIDYIFFGPYEKSSGIKTLSYSFLKVIYDRDDVTIYKVEGVE